MATDVFQVNSWLTEYVYDVFWECFSSSGNVSMSLRFMIDALIQTRSENAMLEMQRMDVILNVIKFVLHILECDPEEIATVDEKRMAEERLWEICQTFEEEPLMNLVLVHNIVSNIRRDDFQAARDMCASLDDDRVTIDDEMKREIRACVVAGNPSHPFVDKFKYKHFLDKAVKVIFDSYAPAVLFAEGRSTLLRAAGCALAQPNRVDSFAIECRCGGSHSAPLSLRLAVENEPFEGSVDASVDAPSVDGDDKFGGDAPTISNLPSTSTQVFLTAKTAPKTPPSLTGGSQISAESSSHWTTPGEDAGVKTSNEKSPPAHPDLPPGKETQELMTQPLFNAPIVLADDEQRLGKDGSAEVDDVDDKSDVGSRKNRSGSQSLFSSAEKRSSGEVRSSGCQSSFKDAQTQEVDVVDASPAQTQAVHTMPYFGAAIGKIIGKVAGKVQDKGSVERPAKGTVGGQKTTISEKDDRVKDGAKDQETERKSDRVDRDGRATPSSSKSDERSIRRDESDRRRRSPQSSASMENERENSPDIFLGKGRRTRPRKASADRKAEKSPSARDQTPSAKEKDEEGSPTERATNDGVSDAETEDYTNYNQRGDDDDFEDYRASSKVAKVQPTVSSTSTEAPARDRKNHPDSNGGAEIESRFFKGKRKAEGKPSKKGDDEDDDIEVDDIDVEDDYRSASKKRKAIVTPTKKKKGKIEWTKAETFHVWKGVQIFGVGNWGKIFEAYEAEFHACRTNISIKDRWRTMVKNGIDKQLSREHRQKRNNGPTGIVLPSTSSPF